MPEQSLGQGQTTNKAAMPLHIHYDSSPILQNRTPLCSAPLYPGGALSFCKFLRAAACEINFFEKIVKKLKKGLHFRCRFAIIIKHRATRAVRAGQQMNMGAFPSGQWGQTVNLLLNASVVRIHQLPPTKRYLIMGIAFVFVFRRYAGGFEQPGPGALRPPPGKNSPAGCL